MKRWLLLLPTLLLGATAAFAQVPGIPNPIPPTAGQNFSACAVLPLTTVPITVASGSTDLVVGVAGQKMHICSLKLLNTGGTAQFNYGTGTNCATGTVHLTGVLSATDGIATYNEGYDVFTVPAANDLCVNGGASAAGTGWLTYVQY